MQENESNVNIKLRKIIENIERLEEEKKELTRQVSDILKEAKAFGFDTKAIRRILSLRRMDQDKRLKWNNSSRPTRTH